MSSQYLLKSIGTIVTISILIFVSLTLIDVVEGYENLEDMTIFAIKTIGAILYFSIALVYLMVFDSADGNMTHKNVNECYRCSIIVCIFAFFDGFANLVFGLPSAIIFFSSIPINVYFIISMFSIMRKLHDESDRVMSERQENAVLNAGTSAQISDGTGILPKYAMVINVEKK